MKQVADYRLLRLLGRGNHGRFYLAEAPPRLGLGERRVAVKVLDRDATDDDFLRVANELQIFAAVPCPQLVELYDAGHDRGTLYYAMEHCRRGSLADQPAGDADAALAAVADAARGAHALHEAGIAHRDIKPANVLLTDDGAKLSDLGLAQLIAPGQTSAGLGPIGSLEFMEPGVLCGERASRASDVWSLGATLHRALAGVSVYGELPAGDLVETLRAVLRTTPRVDPGLADPVREVVARCLAPDRAARWATAAALADALDALRSEVVLR